MLRVLAVESCERRKLAAYPATLEVVSEIR